MTPPAEAVDTTRVAVLLLGSTGVDAATIIELTDNLR